VGLPLVLDVERQRGQQALAAALVDVGDLGLAQDGGARERLGDELGRRAFFVRGGGLRRTG
jgi:hypothetical protein